MVHTTGHEGSLCIGCYFYLFLECLCCCLVAMTAPVVEVEVIVWMIQVYSYRPEMVYVGTVAVTCAFVLGLGHSDYNSPPFWMIPLLVTSSHCQCLASPCITPPSLVLHFLSQLTLQIWKQTAPLTVLGIRCFANLVTHDCKHSYHHNLKACCVQSVLHFWKLRRPKHHPNRLCNVAAFKHQKSQNPWGYAK